MIKNTASLKKDFAAAFGDAMLNTTSKISTINAIAGNGIGSKIIKKIAITTIIKM
jgi:hypothetical protein